MATPIDTEPFDELIEKFSASLGDNVEIALKCNEHLQLSNCWVQLGLLDTTQNAPTEILLGANAAAIEAVSFIALGLLRPAVLSLRSHFELLLMHTFYCTHPIEWDSAKNYQSDHKLPKAIKTYLANHYPGYEKRWKELKAKKTRRYDDCYKILSSVAHGSAMNSISTATTPIELIEGTSTLSQAPVIFHDTAEEISDIYVSHWIANWHSLPLVVRDNLKDRFQGKAPLKELMFE